jgi:hypothetical protein
MGGPLNEEEAHVIQGVLDLSSKTGSKAMTPLDKVCVCDCVCGVRGVVVCLCLCCASCAQKASNGRRK